MQLFRLIIIVIVFFLLGGVVCYHLQSFVSNSGTKKDNSLKQITKNSEIISNLYMEASPFVWKGSLKYFVAERDDKKKLYNLAIYDFQTRKKEVEFGKGLGLASAAVIDGVLYITATKDWFTFGNSEIYLMTSKDLKNFSEPLLIKKADEQQKIFNTTITKNKENNTFVIAYESQDDHSVPFTIYFLESKDGKNWNPVEDAVFGKDVYVACPTIKYIGSYYYLIFAMEERYDPNCKDCHSYIAKISRSRDLKTWNTSYIPFMTPDYKGEGINNSDVDIAEYKGNTYLFYAIGDQSTWGGMKYATFPGNEKELVTKYFFN